jgi:hypothetical protein
MNTTKKEEIYKSIDTISGGKIDIIMTKGKHVNDYHIECITQNKEVEPVMFFIHTLCRVNGEQKGYIFYKNLLAEDYIKLSEAVGESLKPLM